MDVQEILKELKRLRRNYRLSATDELTLQQKLVENSPAVFKRGFTTHSFEKSKGLQIGFDGIAANLDSLIKKIEPPKLKVKKNPNLF